MATTHWLAVVRALLLAQLFWGLSALSAELPERFASVYRISGSITVVDAGTGNVRELKAGDVLNVGDQVRAAPNGEAVLRTDDAGYIAVRPNAVFTMERFSAKGTPEDKLTLRILTGALRLITGWIGSQKKENYQILTATATIGIRGTDHEPYVLSPELATQFRQQEGTYNKVNRGGTSLSASGVSLSIDAGQVGFAPAATAFRHRSLMTVLMPTLLEQVPGFFVAGKFDLELDQLANLTPPAGPKTAGLTDQASADTRVAVTPPSAASSPAASTGDALNADPCRAGDIAAAWLAKMDAAVMNRDPQRYVDLFSPQATITAKVKNADGKTIELAFSRDEFVKSTFAALKDLSQFETRRLALQARPATGSTPTLCDRISVESVVLESGMQSGLRYRIESIETFTLQNISGHWLAVEASTTQR